MAWMVSRQGGYRLCSTRQHLDTGTLMGSYMTMSMAEDMHHIYATPRASTTVHTQNLRQLSLLPPTTPNHTP